MKRPRRVTVSGHVTYDDVLFFILKNFLKRFLKLIMWNGKSRPRRGGGAVALRRGGRARPIA